MSETSSVLLVSGDEIARYGFGEGHPFGLDRHEAFMRELHQSGLDGRVQRARPRDATREELESFHSSDYLDLVRERSVTGYGFLDAGDTPARRGIYEAAASVVGATLVAVDAVMSGRVRRAFIPIAGLHHAARNGAAGFCVFNDCGVAIEILRRTHHVRRIAYVDIDAHHGDGVFYAFEADPDVLIADLHEDGRYLYPGTGSAEETGIGPARGTKLNIPLPSGADDEAFKAAWSRVETYLREGRPEFILFQCGADSLEGDPITHLRLTEEAHAHAATRLCALADELGHGRVVGMGGGGYNRRNLARAWTRVVQSFLESERRTADGGR
jgi:acetoin utilization protein AcuC